MAEEKQRDPANLQIPELDEVVVPGAEGRTATPPRAEAAGGTREPVEQHPEALRAAVVAELLASLDELTRCAAEHALKAAAPVIFERLRTEIRAHLAQRLNELAGSQSDDEPTQPRSTGSERPSPTARPHNR